jgi:patatin-like phospholipase/acyl hydrolase
MANGDGKTVKVLSIDGGGIRGIIPAIILAALQKRLGRNLYEVFDLIAGTSTGGIIALGIGTTANSGQPYSPDKLVDLYVQNGPAIFKKNLLMPVRELFLSKYSPNSLEKTLATFFGATELKTALTPLMISSYDLQGQRPFMFKSHYIAAHPNYNWEVKSVARATSAAPTFFPPYHLVKGSEDYALVDGGVFVNNPAMAAYSEARSLYPEFANVVVISVGTGDRQDSISYAVAKDWGLIGWARQIVPVMMDSVSEAVDYELRFMPGCTFHRLQPSHLEAAENKMDNVTPENLANLQHTAKEYVAAHSADLDTICAELIEGRASSMPGVGL